MMISRRCVSLLLALGLLFGGGIPHAVASDGVASPIPFKRDAAGGENELVRVAIGMVVCVVVLAGVIFVLRRRAGFHPGATGKPRLLRVLETQRLNPRSTLHVVEFAGSHYLIAQNERGISRLASSPLPPANTVEQSP